VPVSGLLILHSWLEKHLDSTGDDQGCGTSEVSG
jgi:hypothetical protein